jgi:hypothetical protein
VVVFHCWGVLGVSSDYYPGLAPHYGQVMDEWYSVQEKLLAQTRPDRSST